MTSPLIFDGSLGDKTLYQDSVALGGATIVCEPELGGRKHRVRMPVFDILRGVSILLIGLFHLNPSWCPNGFYGVDVFIVISGYFLFEGEFVSTRNDFAFVPFIKKKALRVVPGMLAAAALGLLVAVVCSPSCDFAHIWGAFKSAISGRVNIYLDRVGGAYFSANTRHQSLMHLWYIGMYLQSLLLFSALLFVWRRCSATVRTRLISLGFIGLGSFIVSCRWLIFALGFGDVSWTSSTYYLTVARLWEFIAGGAMTLVPIKNNGFKITKRWSGWLLVLSFLGLVGIAFAGVSNAPRYAIVPVALTCFMIYIGRELLFQRWFRLIAAVGVLSYSIYLVHWPLIYLAEAIFGEGLRFREVMLFVPVICIISVVWYWCFEIKRYSVRGMILLFFGVLILGYLLTHSKVLRCQELDSYPMGGDYHVHALEIGSHLWKGVEAFVANTWGRAEATAPLLWSLGRNENPPNFVLIGDSHADRVAIGLDRVGARMGWSGIYLNSYIFCFYGSEFSEVVAPDHTNSPKKHDELVRWLKSQPDIKYVIASQWWSKRFVVHKLWNGAKIEAADILSARTSELREFCVRMRTAGKEVIFLTDNPTVTAENPGREYFCARRFSFIANRHLERLSVEKSDYIAGEHSANAVFHTLQSEGLCKVVDIGGGLFTNNVFYACENGRLMLSDSNHLTAYGAELSVQQAARLLDEYLMSGQ